MTAEDLELDPSFFLTHQPLTLYRLARARYANISGIGAAMAPGRWNRQGLEAIYTSTEVGVPVLERLAHTPKDLIPTNLALMKIRVTCDWQMREGWLAEPPAGGYMISYRSISAAREHFTSKDQLRFSFQLNAFAVAVPSVIVPAWNVVLYPAGRNFWDHVELESVDRFEFDPRLFPDNAPTEGQNRETPP